MGYIMVNVEFHRSNQMDDGYCKGNGCFMIHIFSVKAKCIAKFWA